MNSSRTSSCLHIAAVACILLLTIGFAKMLPTSVWGDQKESIALQLIEGGQSLESTSVVGNGTREDPYVIEDQLFYKERWGIEGFISNTNAYYIIRRCEFISGSTSSLWISNVTNCIVEDCKFNHCPLIVHNSLNCTIRRSSFRNADWLGSSGGIEIYKSVNCSVVNNAAYNCYTGISIQASNNTYVSSNTVYDNEYGILLFFAECTTLQNNQLHNNALYIRCDYMGTQGRAYFWYQYIGAKLYCNGNFVNGRPLLFLQDLTSGNIDASDYGQLILQNCSHVSVHNGDVSNTTYGMQFLFCSDLSISDITAANCPIVAMELFFCNSSVLKRCSFGGSSLWVLDLHHCWNISVEGCSFVDSRYGLFLEDSNNCTVFNSVAERNYYGFVLSYASNSLIVNNTLRENYVGIDIRKSEHNIIVGNMIVFNSYYGIYLDLYSRSNRIFGNAFGWNGHANARSDGSNYFDDGIGMGNLWSDYQSGGVYEINFDSQDNYPSVLFPSSLSIAPDNVLAGAALMAICLVGILRVFWRKRTPQKRLVSPPIVT